MGQKVNPTSFRLINNKDWKSSWYAGKDFAFIFAEDLALREAIDKRYGKTGGIDRVNIARSSQEVTVSIHTSKPGIIIGRSGAGVDDLKKLLAKTIKYVREHKLLNFRAKTKNEESKKPEAKMKVDIIEVRTPELSAQLVASSVAQQLEKRIGYRRAARQTISKVMEKGAKGVKIALAGRLDGVEIARREKFALGSIPLGTIKAIVDYAYSAANTTYGMIGVKVWIYKGLKSSTKTKE